MKVLEPRTVFDVPEYQEYGPVTEGGLRYWA